MAQIIKDRPAYKPRDLTGIDTDPWLSALLEGLRFLSEGRPELAEKGVRLGMMPLGPRDPAAILSKGKEVLKALSGVKTSPLPEAEILTAFKAGDPTSEAQLLERTITPFARKTASRFKGRGLDSEDLAQEGMLKGLEAARQWRQSGSTVPLPQYLNTAIRRAIDRYIMQQGADVALPIKQQQDIRRVEAARGRLKGAASTAEESATIRGQAVPKRGIGEEPGVLLTSKKTGVPTIKVKEILNREQRGLTTPIKPTMAIPELAEAEPSVALKKLGDAGLTEKQLRAVSLNLGLEREPMSIRQIAKEIGVKSPNAVQAQLKGALAKLKAVGIDPTDLSKGKVVSTEEAPRAGSEWFQRAKAIIADLEAKTGAKAELGESIKPARRISGGASEPTKSYLDQVYDEIERLAAGGQRGDKPTKIPLKGTAPERLESYLPVSEGFAQRQDWIPPQLYHATGRTPGILQEGALRASTGYGSGLGGASAPGVSFATDPEAARSSARLLARAGRAVRGEIPSEAYEQALPVLDALRKGKTLEEAGKYAEDIKALMDRDPILAGWPSWVDVPKPERSALLEAVERLKAYYRAREAAGLARDPYLALPDAPPSARAPVAERLRNIRPEGIGVFEIPKTNIPKRTGARFGDDPGEIRVTGDVPTAGGTLWKFSPRDLLGIVGLGGAGASLYGSQGTSGFDVLRGATNRLDPESQAKFLNMYLDQGAK